MRVTLDDETHDGVGGPGHVQDIRLAFRRLAESGVLESQRKARERRREHSQHQPREVLFDRDDGRDRWAAWAASAGWRRTAGSSAAARRWTARGWTAGSRTTGSRSAAAGPGRGDLDQRIAVEPSRRWVGVLCRDFVLADVLVGQLAVDLELYRDEVVAANLSRTPGGDEAPDR
jgi:hypothetical protein